MRLRRIAGAAAAAAVVSGAGLLLASGPSAATPPPTPVTLDATGMSSSSCPLPLNGSIALVPGTAVQFKPGVLGALSSEKLTIKPAPNSTDPNSSATVGVPLTGTTPITFTRATSYALSWQIKTVNVLGVVVGLNDYKGELVISSTVSNCQVAVQVPVPSVSVPVVPSPITSAINGAVSSAVGGVNGVLSPINSALPPVPTLPAVPGLPGAPGLPGTGTSPGVSTSPGADVPGTSYQPSDPTVADRTVPKGYGNGSGQGGVYVPVTGSGGGSSGAGGQAATGNGAQAGNSAASPAVKSGGSPRTVELATSRPRSALGALPTLAVILAILALSGATASYARTFLLQPAEVAAKGPAKPRG
ncbi:hypothetical protein [Jatrophihabitans sp.]|uniref:hypothetical protein n=1 Tax=Jatrophihabitans sp. TaxID=1932789 RepID=UPI002CD76C1B|nr:hypothetical protein [Jatrophihabitans sp.]